MQDQTKNLRKKKVSVGFVVDANSLLEQDVQQEMVHWYDLITENIGMT